MSQNSSDKVTVVGNVLPIAEDSQDKTVKIVKRKGKPIGEIGIDPEASPGNGPYYVKLYDGSVDLSGYDTVEEAMAELKYLVKQSVAEGKRPDRYHIVGKDGKPANLASYADRASAIKDRDEKYPDAVVQQVGPRGKVKGVTEDSDEKQSFKVSYHDPKTRQDKVVKIKARNKDEVLDYCANKGYRDVYVEQGVAEGSGPKEKQKTPYRDINSPEYRAAANKQKQQMAKDNAAEPGKKLVDKIAKKSVTEGYEDNPVANAIYRRLMFQKPDLFTRYGLEYVAQAVEDVADFVGDVEEIGSSDVSGWVRQVEQNLKDKINQYDEPMQDIDRLAEMSVGSVATVVNPTPKNKAKVGTLFGGTYKQKKAKA